MRRYPRLLLAGLCMFCGAVQPSIAEQASENELKTAFIFNFIQFVDWSSKGAPSGAVLSLCVTTNSPLASALATLRNRQVNGKTLAVLNWPDEPWRRCNVIVADAADRSRLIAGRKHFADNPVLIIGTDADINREGVMIGMELVGSRIVFDIDANMAQQAGLTISSRLLKLARRVQ